MRLEQLEIHLTDLANRDPLTGLWNRRRFEQDLSRQLARCKRYVERAALVVLDIDGFKQVNDTFGHLAGDDVLRAIAGALSERLRTTDSAGRLGGDEFAGLLPNAMEDEARADVAWITRPAAEGACVQAVVDRGDTVGVVAGHLLPGSGRPAQAGHVFAAEAATNGTPRATLWVARRDPMRSFADPDRELVEALAPVARDEIRRESALRQWNELASMRALVAAVTARDGYTGGHSRQVVSLARPVALRMGLDEANVSEVERVALLHDLGNIAVPDSILRKRGPLTDLEQVLMRQHPVVGSQIVASTPELQHLASAIRAEHERWDGVGYPDGLVADEIPLASRITFVCDAYHAMTSHRPHRQAMSRNQARAEIERCAGTQFCPMAAQALLDVLAEGTALRHPEQSVDFTVLRTG